MTTLTPWQMLRVVELRDLIRRNITQIGEDALGSQVVPLILSTTGLDNVMQKAAADLLANIEQTINERSRLN